MLAAEHRLFLVTSRARTHARVHAGIKGAKGAPGVQQVYFKASTSTNSDKNWSTYEKRNGWLSGHLLSEGGTQIVMSMYRYYHCTHSDKCGFFYLSTPHLNEHKCVYRARARKTREPFCFFLIEYSIGSCS